eukprot:TRINITY_DN8164_c0_g1_i1.p1 TRINITY_DN8164_c0_g1~~TRINITY_DN8164_c0_g1_i1.p1  ORF type:complete len:114 (-),score=24.80 TRINITY_DN8164_c0_g1_i1:108-449(-)
MKSPKQKKNYIKQMFNKNKSEEYSGMRNWDTNNVSLFLTKIGMQKKTKKFVDERVDGYTLITLLTNIDALYLLKDDFDLTETDIDRLCQFYQGIFIYRKNNSPTFQSDEKPPY